MKRISLLIAVLSALMSSQCKKEGSSSGSESSEESPEGTTEVGNVLVTVTTEGDAFLGQFTALAGDNQVMALPDDGSELGGSFITVAPGALAVDTTLVVSKEADIGEAIVASAAGDNAVESAGPAVSVKPSIEQNAVGTITIGIPLPEGVQELSPTTAVAYTTKNADTGATESGLIASGTLKLDVPPAGSSTALYLVEGRKIVSFPTKFFGTFQTLKLKNPIGENVTATATSNLPKTQVQGCTGKETAFPEQPNTTDGFYRVCTAAQLKLIASRPMTLKYRLGANISMKDQTFAPIGTEAAPFTGHFDGANFTISDLSYTEANDAEHFVGFFRAIGPAGIVSNLSLSNANIDGGNIAEGENYFTGVVAGISSGTIERVKVSGSVKGTCNVGGVAGRNFGTVKRSSSAAAVSGYGFLSLGGLVAKNGEYDEAQLSLQEVATPVIEDSFVTGNIGTAGMSGNSGGLAEENNGIIRRSYYAAGTIHGEYAGGLVRYAYSPGMIQDVFFDGTVAASMSGDYFIASMSFGSSTNYFASSSAVCNQCDPPATENMTSSADLKSGQHAVVASWDASVWNKPNNAYPTLK